ncbi:MAG: histidine ammonia-lyase [Bacteroidetes bacterium]|nr:histidine ammonia-lyase [Bacteroidota bacterium]
MPSEFKYGIDTLTYSTAMRLANGLKKGIIDELATEKIRASQDMVEEMAAGETPFYGVNTGFGPLCTQKIEPEDTVALQHNLLKSHSAGVGDPVPEVIARLMLITKLHSLAQGFSGIRLVTLERIVWHLEAEVIPVVPRKGSVGASGDLAPLAHLFLPLIGLGKVTFKGLEYESSDILKKFDLEPLELRPKEGLALINGTQLMVSYAVHFLYRFHKLLDLADVIGAMSLDGIRGSVNPFLEELHDLRPFKGSKLVAGRMRALLEGSTILANHEDCERVQDPYSVRCIPAIHGASRNAFEHLREVTEVELNSVTDNPIILTGSRSISGGNFHGQPIAIPMDYCTVAASEIGNVSERRSYLMLEGKFGLPPMLIENSGLHSGFMIPQYTAAALVSENKTLCYPASADSIPTSMGQEDHVSMGPISCRKGHEVILNLEHIQAIELFYALQAIDFRRPDTSSPLLEAVHAHLREVVPFTTEDRIFSKDIHALHTLISTNELIDFVNSKAEALGIEL